MNSVNKTDMGQAKAAIPLAERLRPDTLADIVGQTHLLGEDKILWRLLNSGYIPSLILWGPPGCGKTTLAKLLAQASQSHFVFFSAVLSGIKEVRDIVQKSQMIRDLEDRQTILFVDEIHRFNKSQQDGFLPHVESGLLTLIGATTENPSFNVIAPLLSRCKVLVLEPLDENQITTLLKRALSSSAGLASLQLTIADDALAHLAQMADGDARRALNSLEISASIAERINGHPTITLKSVEEAMQKRSLRYDKDGEEHYNLISALHKSLRDSDPDGSLYWLCRMLTAGEDPLYVARRLVRFASEDIGNADPQALTIALNGRNTYHLLGSPEGELALAQAVLYLATAPKSNAVYTAYQKVQKDIARTGSLAVPKHIRNAPTKLMKDLGYGKGYQYAHDNEQGLVDQNHLPSTLEGTTYYHPTNRGHEAIIKDRLTKWREILRKRKES